MSIIGRILIIEFKEQDLLVFDEVMEFLNQYPCFEHLRIKDEPMVSLPGLEIYPNRHKIYRDRREINLTAKEYEILALLVANKGRVLTYDQIYQKVWAKKGLAARITRWDARFVIFVKNCTRQNRMHHFQSVVYVRSAIVLK